MKYLLFGLVGVVTGVLFMAFCGTAHAMDADTASAKCATAIDDRLRDPASADYQFTLRLASGSGDNWVVMLPVRAQNAFGGYVISRFVCSIKGGKVVQVAR